jgi:hypothetical protein
MNESEPQFTAPEAGANPAPSQSAPNPPPASGPPTGGLSVRQWAMFLHLAQFLGYIVPGLGFAGPIVIWLVYKERFPELDAHGKMVTNWLISLLIYATVAGVVTLASCGIGVVLFIPLMLVSIIFPIIGAVKANEGLLWKYPVTIPFLK